MEQVDTRTRSEKMRSVVRNYEPFLNGVFTDEEGCTYTLDGLLLGQDAVYYMLHCHDDCSMVLLSSDITIEQSGFKLVG